MLSYRFFFLAMQKCGMMQDVSSSKPAENLLMHGMVLADQKKMSKHVGNVVDPEQLIQEFGADSIRIAMFDSANARKDFNWNPDVIRSAHRMLKTLYGFVVARRDVLFPIGTKSHEAIDSTTPARRKLKKWHAMAVKKVTSDFEAIRLNLASQNVATLLKKIQIFADLIEDQPNGPGRRDLIAMRIVVGSLLRLLEPMAPHIASELWQLCDGGVRLSEANWPSANVSTTNNESPI